MPPHVRAFHQVPVRDVEAFRGQHQGHCREDPAAHCAEKHARLSGPQDQASRLCLRLTDLMPCFA